MKTAFAVLALFALVAQLAIAKHARADTNILHDVDAALENEKAFACSLCPRSPRSRHIDRHSLKRRRQSVGLDRGRRGRWCDNRPEQSRNTRRPHTRGIHERARTDESQRSASSIAHEASSRASRSLSKRTSSRRTRLCPCASPRTSPQRHPPPAAPDCRGKRSHDPTRAGGRAGE
jgi:hypothetical protein